MHTFIWDISKFMHLVISLIWDLITQIYLIVFKAKPFLASVKTKTVHNKNL